MYYALTYLIKICKYLFKKFKNGTTTEFWHCSLMEFGNAFFCFYIKFSQKINFYGQVGNKNIVKIGIKWKFLKWIKNEVWVSLYRLGLFTYVSKIQMLSSCFAMFRDLNIIYKLRTSSGVIIKEFLIIPYGLVD